MKNLNLSAPGDPSLAPGQASTSETLDSIEYFAFPNACSFPAVGIRHFHQTLDDYLERRP